MRRRLKITPRVLVRSRPSGLPCYESLFNPTYGKRAQRPTQGTCGPGGGP